MIKYEGKHALSKEISIEFLSHLSVLKVRERGKFWLRRIHLEDLTLEELYKKIRDKYADDPATGKGHTS
jgi:hypothetical protein